MPRNDFYYQHVIDALERDGWTITHDPYPLVVGAMEWSVDLGAERVIAERGMEKIAVEIKNFRHSESNELHKARGQFANYRDALQRTEPGRKLYLAIPKTAYNKLFLHPHMQDMIRTERMSIIVFDPDFKMIVEWKD
jgi:hypothetical protein